MRFLRKWLVPLLAALMLLSFAAAFLPLSARETAEAKSDLTELVNTAFARIAAAKDAAAPVVAAEQASLLNKARAVGRFLEHDDTLLATDALSAFCEQLTIDQIDVANAQGVLIASSDAARVGLALGEDKAFAWTMGAIDDPTAPISKTDETDQSLLYCCLPRADIEGFVLLTLDDSFIDDALDQSSVEALTADLPYGGDLLFQAEPGGADGFFTDSGSLCLRSTSDGVTLIAARQNARIYDARNTALVALAAMLLCVMICGVAGYLLQTEAITLETSEEPRLEDGGDAPALDEPSIEPTTEPTPESAPETARAKKRARLFSRRKPAQEEAEIETEAGTEEKADAAAKPEDDAAREREHEQAVENAPRQIGRGKHPKSKGKPPETPGGDEEPFDTILD